jgi:hypothetical protein
MTKIDTTIERLAAATTRAEAPPTPGRAVALWLVVSLGVSLLMMLTMTLRTDLAAQCQQNNFWREAVVLIGIIISSSVSAIWLSYPDLRQQRWVVALPLPFLAAYIFLLASRALAPVAATTALEADHSIECSLCIMIFALIPGLMLFRIMRRYATAHPRAAGTLALLASASIGNLALKFAEANDSVPHLLLWHMTPIILLGVGGGWLGKKFLSW